MNNILLPEILQTYEYYKNKLPLYLQEDSKYMSHFKNWYDLLKGNSNNNGILGSANLLFQLLNIFDENYLNTISQLENYNSNENDVLDKIGNLFGVTRKFKQTYTNSLGQEVTTTFDLNNRLFLILIKTQIIRNYCNGTQQQIQEYYRNTANLNLYVYTNQDNIAKGKAVCQIVYIIPENDSPDETILEMLEAGLLNIESVGVKYQYDRINSGLQLYWAENESDVDKLAWDEGEWTI